jgi:tetratricopeptide (TPR) repeat protein
VGGWVGVIDETQLRSVLCEELPEYAPDINKILNQQLDLSLRLKQLFKQFAAFQQALFIFDDFEQNFIDAPVYQQIQPAAYAIIRALLTAIHTTGFASRVLITTRGALTMPAPLSLSTIHLDAFRDADLDKKTTALRLTYLGLKKTDPVSEQEQRAIGLGVGNPRLLESLYRVLADKKLPHDEILTTLTHTQAQFRENLLLQKLLNYQTDATCKLCATLALFECFMPKAVLTAVFDNTTLEHSLQAALAVGLIEEYQDRYLVSRLVIPLVDALNAEQQKTSYSLAANCLDALWSGSDYQISLEESLELSRLAKYGEEKIIFSNITKFLARRLYEICRYDEAKCLYEDLLPIQKELEDKKGEGLCLNQIGLIHKLRGNYETALTYYQQSLNISQDIADKENEGITLNNIATTEHAKSNYDKALCYLKQSLKIMQTLDNKRSEVVMLNNLATTAYAKDDDKVALDYLTQALKIHDDINDKYGDTTVDNYAAIAYVKGQYRSVSHYLRQFTKTQQHNVDKLCNTVNTCNYIGNINITHQYNEIPEYNERNDIYIYGEDKSNYDAELSYLEKTLKSNQDMGDIPLTFQQLDFPCRIICHDT